MMKKPKNEMKLQIYSRSVNESYARVAVAAFVAQLDPTVDEIADVKTAVSEAVTNSIVHAYKNTIGIIYITTRIYEGGRVTIVIRDKGCGIEDVSKAMEPLFTTSPSGERAGLGFTVMQSFMDKLRVKSRVGFGTTVQMERQLGKIQKQ
ncbi:MAG: anti-sigma F factor [Clostridia bacterium]|nr:anti-sigma F factor [Clostridia bacterium]